MKVTVLGCGGSAGVPTIGNRWGVCDPLEPRNTRRRPSVLVEHGGTVLLIDTTPELRLQLIDAGVVRLDAVLYTHEHADHSHGIDDLREINRLTNAPLPVYGLPETIAGLTERFSYAFRPLPAGDTFYYRPVLDARIIGGVEPFSIGAIQVVPFYQDHGRSTTLGYRFGDFAYSTDVKTLDEAAFATLSGITVWLVDCVGEAPHPVHSHLANTLAWIRRVQPRRAWLTHMNNSLDYRRLVAALPAGIAPAHDGLVIDIDSC